MDDCSKFIFVLLRDCPRGNPAPDCPLEKFRHEPLNKQAEIVLQLPTEELETIIKHHNICLFNSLQNKVPIPNSTNLQ
jgi:hypothetical protein